MRWGIVSNAFLKSIKILQEMSRESKTSYKCSVKFAMANEVDLFLRNPNCFEVNSDNLLEKSYSRLYIHRSKFFPKNGKIEIGR